MVSHYTAIVFMSIVAMIAFIIGVYGDSFMEDDQKKWFIWLSVALIAANSSEWLAEMLKGNLPLIPLRTAAKFLELSLTPTIVLLASFTVGKSKYTRPMQAIVVFNLTLQIVSLFNGAVFSIGSDGVYHRNALYPVYVALYLIASILVFMHFYGTVRRYQLTNTPLLVAIFTMEILAVAVQLAFSYLRLDWTMISFTVILFYFYIIQLLQQTDALTGLLNRRIYRVHVQRAMGQGLVIMFDIDKFKIINDTYGHKEGDECIKAIAERIRNTFAGVGKCYRYGGDEFVVLMKDHTDQVEKYLESLDRSIKEGVLPNGIKIPMVSHGIAPLSPGKSYAEVMELADQRMYEYKKAHRESRQAE